MELRQIEGVEVASRNKLSEVFAFGIHEFILILVIILNFLGFFHLLTAEIDYMEKIISWTILGLLLHKANLSNIFFGDKNPVIDVSIILCYFGMIFKDLVEFSLTAIEDSPNSLFTSMFSFIVDNADYITRYSFKLSAIFLILLAFYIAVKIEFKIPSVMHIIHEDGLPRRNILKIIERFVLTNLVLFGFFVIVFNLISEWLAIAVDDPLLLLGILFYFFKGKKLTVGTKIEKLGSMGEDFYERFVEMFKSRKKIFLALSGMLVLHIITDVANFILPYTLKLSSTLYSRLGANHISIIELANNQSLANPGFMSSLNIFCGYGINVLGITLLLISSSIVWYHLLYEKPLKFRSFFIFIFFFSVIFFLLNPAFSITRIDQSFNVLGTDIRSNEISLNPIYFLISFVSALIIAIANRIEKLTKFVSIAFAGVTTVFFVYYIFFYFTSIAQFYITFFFNASDVFLMTVMGLIAFINVIFYLVGTITFVLECWT